MGDPCAGDVMGLGDFTNVVSGGLTFDGGIGGQNHLLDVALFESGFQLVQAQLTRANAIKG